jgi:hypothetical protein
MRIAKSFFYFFLFVQVIMCLCFTTIVYGHGLGDIVYYGLLYTSLIIQLFINYYLKKNGNMWGYIIAASIFGGITIFLVYSATIGRGGEYSWDGNVFIAK